MKYQETGRFGRITKHLRGHGFEKEMADILFDSDKFTTLPKKEQTAYIETVITRMDSIIGEENAAEVLFACGEQCCGKSWSDFVNDIYDNAASLDDFFTTLNEKEAQYNTRITWNSERRQIIVERLRCICGLINKGRPFTTNAGFCRCSLGHMSSFFNTVFPVEEIQLVQSIYDGSETCRWHIQLYDAEC